MKNLVLVIINVFLAAYSSTALANNKCTKALKLEKSFIEFTKEKADAWDSKFFTDPKQHDPDNYMYIGHIPRNLYDFTVKQTFDRIEGRTRSESCRGTLVCTSLLTNKHNGTFSDNEPVLILKVPKTLFVTAYHNDMSTVNHDGASKNVELTYQMAIKNFEHRNNGLPSPAEIVENSLTDTDQLNSYSDIKIYPGPGINNERVEVIGLRLDGGNYHKMRQGLSTSITIELIQRWLFSHMYVRWPQEPGSESKLYNFEAEDILKFTKENFTPEEMIDSLRSVYNNDAIYMSLYRHIMDLGLPVHHTGIEPSSTYRTHYNNETGSVSEKQNLNSFLIEVGNGSPYRIPKTFMDAISDVGHTNLYLSEPNKPDKIAYYKIFPAEDLIEIAKYFTPKVIELFLKEENIDLRKPLSELPRKL